METVWLSFANEKEFGGLIVVDVEWSEVAGAGLDWAEIAEKEGLALPSDQQKLFFVAVRKTIEMGINPGPDYSVKVGLGGGKEVPADFKNRLLNETEVRALEQRATPH
jgi:hypothetical protein